MAGKAWLVVTLALIAGCVSPQEDVSSAALDLLPGAGMAFEAPITGAAGGALTAFWWTVPEGGVVPWAWNDEFERDIDVVALEVALDLPDDAAVDAWALLTFQEGRDGLETTSHVARAPMTGWMRDGLQRQAFEEETDVAPLFTHAAFDDVEPGDRIGFVVALSTPMPTEGRIVFRALHEDFDHRDEPANDAEDLLDDLDAPPLALPVAGTGTGLHVGQYMRWSDVAFVLWDYELTMGDVEVQDARTLDARPAATVGRTTLASAMPASDEGWGVAAAFVYRPMGTGTWSARADVRGEIAEGNGRLAPTPATGLFGYPAIFALGDGPGPFDVGMSVDSATLHNPDAIFFFATALGTPVETMLGEEVETDTYASRSIVPHLYEQGGATRLRIGGMETLVPTPRGA